MDKAPRIAIVMGSDSDLPTMKSAVEVMQDFDMDFDLRVMSAHRSPDATHEFARTAEERGVKVIIAGAGGAAHLAGVIASKTALPVIGVPMPTDRAGGIDSMFSTLLAIQILALSDDEVAAKFKEFKEAQVDGVEESNQQVQDWLAGQQ